MSENLIQAITDAVSRVSELDLEQQPGEFAKIREVLEAELNSTASSVTNTAAFTILTGQNTAGQAGI